MKILLLQLKRIGDLILTTPAIAALRDKFPGARITLVVARECADLLPAIASVNRTLVTRRNLRDVTMFFAVAREKFDYCIDFTRNDRSALLAFLSGAQKRVVSHRIKVQSKSRARVYNEFARHRMREMHTLDYHLALLEPLGIDNASPRCTWSYRGPRAKKRKSFAVMQRSTMPSLFSIQARRAWKNFGERSAGPM